MPLIEAAYEKMGRWLRPRRQSLGERLEHLRKQLGRVEAIRKTFATQGWVDFRETLLTEYDSVAEEIVELASDPDKNRQAIAELRGYRRAIEYILNLQATIEGHATEAMAEMVDKLGKVTRTTPDGPQ